MSRRTPEVILDPAPRFIASRLRTYQWETVALQQITRIVREIRDQGDTPEIDEMLKQFLLTAYLIISPFTHEFITKHLVSADDWKRHIATCVQHGVFIIHSQPERDLLRTDHALFVDTHRRLQKLLSDTLNVLAPKLVLPQF